MEKQPSPNEYRFQANDIRIRFWTRFWNYISSVFNRKNTIKSFCYKNNIEYPPKRSKKYHLATSYVVDNEEIKRWFKIRDQIILVKHEKYAACQQELEKILSTLQHNLSQEKQYLEELQKRLSSMKTKLKSARNPLDRISLEDNIATANASIKNQKDTIASVQDSIDSTFQTMADNKETWFQQVEIIDGAIILQVERYVTSVTKHIRNKLNYNEFKYATQPYGEAIEKIVKGQYNEK